MKLNELRFSKSDDKGRYASPLEPDANGLPAFNFDKYQDFYHEVTQVRCEISRGVYPQWFIDKYYPFEGEAPQGLTQPLLNAGLSAEDPRGLANVVHMDLPADMPNYVLKWLLSSGTKLKGVDYENQIPFLDMVVSTTENIADGYKLGLRKAFEAKYFFKVARPEEVHTFLTGYNGAITTEYVEGCPVHPSYPAGHGAAAAGGVKRLLRDFDIQCQLN